jgi:hypothetical protein|uniref:Uncharacterized protein n=1 Tax=viral metagenome TaxID=1070528 RepID=A0A6C0JDE9_9ZZZZ
MTVTSLLKTTKKFILDNIVLIVALLIGVLGLGLYSRTKTSELDTFEGEESTTGNDDDEVKETGDENKKQGAVAAPGVQPSNPLGTNGDFAQIQGISTSGKQLPSANKDVNKPADLLPVDQNSEWAKLNPKGQGGLEQFTTLSAAHHAGTSTSLGRNTAVGMQSVRGEEPNPRGTLPSSLSTIGQN